MGEVPTSVLGTKPQAFKSAPRRGGHASLGKTGGQSTQSHDVQQTHPKGWGTQRVAGWTPDPGSRSQGGKPRMGTERPGRGTESKGCRQATGQAGETHAGPRGLRDGPSFQSVSPAPPKVRGSGLWSSHSPALWSEQAALCFPAGRVMLGTEKGLVMRQLGAGARENRWSGAAQGTREKGSETAAQGSRPRAGLQLTPRGATGIWVGGRGLHPSRPLSLPHRDHSSGPSCPLPVTQAWLLSCPRPAGRVRCPSTGKAVVWVQRTGRGRGPLGGRRRPGREALAPSGRVTLCRLGNVALGCGRSLSPSLCTEHSRPLVSH